MSIEHTDVAAYSLGLLDQHDREDFEAHLSGCEECLAELGEFSAMADLFAGVGPVRVEDEQPDEATVIDFVARRAAVQRQKSRRRVWLAAAASIVLLAGGVAAGLGLSPTGPQISGHVFSSKPIPHSGLKGVVGLVAKSWGTQVTLKLSDLKKKSALKCQLIAVSKTGQRRVIVGWIVTPHGLGTPGHAPLLLVGGTWLTQDQLSEIQIQVFHGPTLLTISI